MRCSYWNSEKLNAISEFSASMNKEYNNTDKTITCNNIPNVLNICGADVNMSLNVRQEGLLDIQSVSSKASMKTLIQNNVKSSNGFLMWYPNYCFSLIFEKYYVKATKYFLIGYFADQNLNLFEKFNDIVAVIDVLCNLVQRRLGCDKTNYNIQFVSCLCKLSKSHRNKVLRHHK